MCSKTTYCSSFNSPPASLPKDAASLLKGKISLAGTYTVTVTCMKLARNPRVRNNTRDLGNEFSCSFPVSLSLPPRDLTTAAVAPIDVGARAREVIGNGSPGTHIAFVGERWWWATVPHARDNFSICFPRVEHEEGRWACMWRGRTWWGDAGGVVAPPSGI
jgi:hypothetical protein